MLKFIDKFLNGTTMYRLVLYYLCLIWIFALIFGFLGIMSYSPASLIFSLAVIMAVSWVINTFLAYIFKAPVNIESVYITAFILALIITPVAPLPYDSSKLLFLILAAVFAMASKYILAIKKKHIFNPAALAVVITAFTINQSASWWVGSAQMFPIVIFGGILVVRKLQRSDMVFSFLIVALLAIVGSSLAFNPATIIERALIDTPLLFFAFVMLSEPFTTPPTKALCMVYGALVGVLFAPQIHIGEIYPTPELALLFGNIFSYIVSPKVRYMLKLKEKKEIARGLYDFVFASDSPLIFRPGQYLEWTLGHKHADTRGVRRYFTIASSPTETEARLGIRFYDNPSTFKKSLVSMNIGDEIAASRLAGDFTLPKDKNKKLAFIAGGIGITPFRSMIKYLLDSGERRPITLFYSVKTALEIAYKDIFDDAVAKLGIKVIYVINEVDGFLTGEMIKKDVPDYTENLFYLSGPHSMVTAFEATLKNMGVKKSKIKIDFFPGYV